MDAFNAMVKEWTETYFFPRDISPYRTPVANIRPQPMSRVNVKQSPTGGMDKLRTNTRQTAFTVGFKTR